MTLMMAKLVWLIFLHLLSKDISRVKAPILNTQEAKQGDVSFNIEPLLNKHLFGQKIKRTETVQNAPETRLNLKLRGVYYSNDPKLSNAVIEDGSGKQAVYFINNKLNVAGRVYLRNVHPYRVILETNGQKEVLSLKDSLPANLKRKLAKNKKNRHTKKIEDKRQNKTLTRALNGYKSELIKNPMSLSDLVRMSPSMKKGKTVGYRISPGKNKQLFTQLGLRRNDVITSVNGISLSDPKNAMQLFSDMKNMKEIQLDILRGNENIRLLLDLSQP
jgi:general secretion pathway protein C